MAISSSSSDSLDAADVARSAAPPPIPPPLPASAATSGAPQAEIALGEADLPPGAGAASSSPGEPRSRAVPDTRDKQGAAARKAKPNRSPPQLAPTSLVTLGDGELAVETFWQQVPSWLLSSVFHLVFILILASYSVVAGSRSQSSLLATIAGGAGDGQGLDDGGLDEPVASAPLGTELKEVLQPTSPGSVGGGTVDSSALLPAAPDIASPLNALTVPIGGSGTGTGLGGAATGVEGGLLEGIGNSITDSLQGRLSATNRARLVGTGGGTPASENAVASGLQWLSEHQNSDGSWSFAHMSAPRCAGRCSNPGSQGNAMVASTALGLLPFLGAGETHRQGKYKRNVDMALHYLGRTMHQLGGNGGMWETGGRMYGHGLAAIALCEAYGMTRDSALETPAQKSIDFIVAFQDPVGGGWRYFPHQSGDTSVVGWQLMALKSANMAYLKVPQDTIRKAGYFLDSVQEMDGAMYGYTSPGEGSATSAIGLLCRMYTGWKHDRPALVRGVSILSENGPSLDDSGPPRNNMYYNYYGTQVLHHYGGYEWNKWNAAMREYLIATQGKSGHEAGSWYFDGTDYGSKNGGRLYCTAMATMILEVYYRHLPLYTDLSTKDAFK